MASTFSMPVCLPVAELLIRSGAGVNLRSRRGETALMIAVSCTIVQTRAELTPSATRNRMTRGVPGAAKQLSNGSFHLAPALQHLLLQAAR